MIHFSASDPLGAVIDVRAPHSETALLPIAVIEAGKEMEVSFEQE